MNMIEKIAYLKGLAEGLEIDTSKKEGKLLAAIIDTLSEMSDEILDVKETCEELDELVDIIDEDLGNLEDDFYEDDCDCDCDSDCDCGCQDDEDEFDDDEPIYEVTCPNCNDVVYLDEGTICEGEIDCPNCGQNLEFDLTDCGCGCGCGSEEDCDCDDDCECGCGK